MAPQERELEPMDTMVITRDGSYICYICKDKLAGGTVCATVTIYGATRVYCGRCVAVH